VDRGRTTPGRRQTQAEVIGISEEAGREGEPLVAKDEEVDAGGIRRTRGMTPGFPQGRVSHPVMCEEEEGDAGGGREGGGRGGEGGREAAATTTHAVLCQEGAVPGRAATVATATAAAAAALVIGLELRRGLVRGRKGG